MNAKQTTQPKRDPRVADAIASTVADILTLSEREARARIKAAPALEIEALHKAFSSGVQQIGVHACKWRAHTLSRLPLSQWKSKDGFFSVGPFKEASLKYLNTAPPDEKNERALDQLENRKALCDALVETLPGHVLEEHHGMLEWVKIKTHHDAHPLLEDIALAYGVHAVEYLFYAEYRKRETMLRDMKGIPATETTPHDWMSWLGERACVYAKANLTMWDVLPLPSLQADPILENEEAGWRHWGRMRGN